MTVLLSALCLAGAVNFNFDWQWRPKGGEDWTAIDLPHDCLIDAPWDAAAVHSQRAFKRVPASAEYRKDFAWDPAWRDRRVILDFGGVMFYGDVFLNGTKVASTEYGSLGFEVDIAGNLLTNASNRIVVTANVDGGPDGCRWYTGCGLYRDVTLKAVGERRIARHGVCVRTRENRFVDIEVEVLGCTDLRDDVEVRAELDGQVVTAPVPKGDMRRRVPVKLPTVTLAAPRLWSVEAPNLYELKVKVANDERTVRFGVRTIAFDKSFGFRLNGKKVFLKGMSNHSDFGALGVAAYRDAIARQFRLMKEFGYNAVRCSHNPYSEDFYALADEMGLLVVDELTDKWCGCWAGRKPFLEMWEELLTEWIRRDRNHPSVILWSLGNELQHEERPSGLETGDWGVTQYRMMDVLTKHWDPTRPTTVANYPSRAGGVMKRDRRFWEKAWTRAPELARATEVASFNYRPEDYATYLSFDPGLNIFQSEASTSRWLEPYDLMDRERMTGLCYWGAIEYWGESNAFPKKGWNFSFFSHALRPYPQAYLIRSAFSDEPVVRLGVVGRAESLEWNDVKTGAVRLEESWNRADGDRVTVLAFSNAPEVELLLNGRSLGKTRTDGRVAKFENVGWTRGELKALASNGAVHALRTAGAKAGLRLRAEETGAQRADGLSLRYVWIEAVDRNGTVVPDATDEVSVRVTGAARLLALDEDDHCTEQRFAVDRKRLNGGRLLAVVRAGRDPGTTVLEANGERIEWRVE